VMMFLRRGLVGLLDALARRVAAGFGRTSALPHPRPASPAPQSAICNPKSAIAGQAVQGPLLEVAGLSKAFGGVQAVDDCSFGVATGEIVAVIGPNGAGKTTLFNVVTGIHLPTRGAVRFRGRAVHGLSPHRIAALGLSRTFQNVQIFPSLSAVENVMVGCHMAARSGFLESALPLPRPRREERWALGRALACLERVGLAEAAFAPAAGLPFGAQKKLEMARAVATAPALLLLDEPAAGLNDAETAEMARLIGRLRDAGISILLIEHDMRLVMEVSDRVVVLNYGRRIAEGTPGQVRDDPEVVRVYLGDEVAVA
jgi:branched-chain amino acid transport system ATP-binding protein